jgi:DNA repair protein RadD
MSAPPLLRPYQEAVVDDVRASLAAERCRVLVAMATGAGKTVVAAHLIDEAVQRGEGVLFVAHRRELIIQASNKLSDVGVTDHGIIKAGYPTRLSAPVQVASVQTLHARAFRTRKIGLPRFGLVVIDEAHHARARTYQQIVDAFPRSVIIGLTATPCRGDGLGLGNMFQELIEGPEVSELIAAGHLVGTRVFAPFRPDLSGVHTRQGDYVVSELATAMNQLALVGDIVENWFKHGGGRRTVCFAVDVAHSLAIRNEFQKAGVAAEHIDGKTPQDERDAILARLSAGELRAVSNCMVLTEGWDQPPVSCIVLARPTKRIGLYRQMVGRVLRPYPGKQDAIVIDHAGAVHVHGFAEDPVYWTLHEDEFAVNATHQARLDHHAPGLTECPECHAVRLEGQPCGSCGWRPTQRPRFVDFADGELGEVDRRRQVHPTEWTLDEQMAFYRQLMGVARQRDRKPGWAAHKFREKFGGVFPPWSWNNLGPLSPCGAVLAWVRSRDIAYAKAMRAQR